MEICDYPRLRNRAVPHVYHPWFEERLNRQIQEQGRDKFRSHGAGMDDHGVHWYTTPYAIYDREGLLISPHDYPCKVDGSLVKVKATLVRDHDTHPCLANAYFDVQEATVLETHLEREQREQKEQEVRDREWEQRFVEYMYSPPSSPIDLV